MIENFVIDWYLTTDMLELSKRRRLFKMLIFLTHFLRILLFVYHFFLRQASIWPHETL